MCVTDAHRDDGKRFVLRADGTLIASIERHTAIVGHLDPRFRLTRFPPGKPVSKGLAHTTTTVIL
jgi:hypothetical protein